MKLSDDLTCGAAAIPQSVDAADRPADLLVQGKSDLTILAALQTDRQREARWASPTGRTFPTPQDLASADPTELRRRDFSSAKARTIIDTARAVAGGTLDLEGLAWLDDRVATERLVSPRGIERWTAEYVMLRGLGRLDIFPRDDIGARNKLERFLGAGSHLDSDGVRDLVTRWQPYACIVYFHLLPDSLSEAGVVARELATSVEPEGANPYLGGRSDSASVAASAT